MRHMENLKEDTLLEEIVKRKKVKIDWCIDQEAFKYTQSKVVLVLNLQWENYYWVISITFRNYNFSIDVHGKFLNSLKINYFSFQVVIKNNNVIVRAHPEVKEN